MLASATCDDAARRPSSDDPMLGRRIQLTGLINCPSFNGLWGIIERVEKDTGWYLVRVQTPNYSKGSVIAKVRSENLHVPAIIELDFDKGNLGPAPDAPTNPE